MRTLSKPTAATETPKFSSSAGEGLVKVIRSAPLVLNKYAAPAFVAPASSLRAPMSTLSEPTAATDQPKASKAAGVGLVKVISSAPLVLKRYAAPAAVALVLSLGAPMRTLSGPTAATELPN